MTPRSQTEPYGDHPPYQRHSETSAEAAARVARKATTLRERVLYQFVAADVLNPPRHIGLTDHELAALLHVPLQTAVPRRRELVIAGLVRDSGRKRRTPSGRRATVWVRTGDGEQMELL